MDPFTFGAILLALAALTGGTRSGRSAVGNAVRSGYQATGWRTPGKALAHHSGRAGAATGQLLGKSARAGRVLAGRGARATGRVTKRGAVAGRDRLAARWVKRRDGDATPRPLLTLTRPNGAPDVRPNTGSDATPDARPTARSDGAASGGPSAQAPTRDPNPPGRPAPGPDTAAPNPTGPGDGPTPTAPPTLNARVRAERSTTPMARRFSVNLEAPTSDAEFLESCVELGDVLKALSSEIEEWAEGLKGMNLPRSVTQPLDSIAEGIEEAASGASEAAQSFEDEFEDAREVASRGMKITGQDAA